MHLLFHCLCLRYIDPQYVLREELTTASDVYSFGMVLLEIISGQRSVDNQRSDDRNLIEWVKRNVKFLEIFIYDHLTHQVPLGKCLVQNFVNLKTTNVFILSRLS